MLSNSVTDYLKCETVNNKYIVSYAFESNRDVQRLYYTISFEISIFSIKLSYIFLLVQIKMQQLEE